MHKGDPLSVCTRGINGSTALPPCSAPDMKLKQFVYVFKAGNETERRLVEGPLNMYNHVVPRLPAPCRDAADGPIVNPLAVSVAVSDAAHLSPDAISSCFLLKFL